MTDIPQLYDLNLYGESSDDNILANPLHLFFQEIELAVKIAPGEIWGMPQGIDLKKYLFNQFISLHRIQTEVSEFIAKHCEHAQYFPYEIETDIVTVDQKELIYIGVKVSNPDKYDETFLQQFLLTA